MTISPKKDQRSKMLVIGCSEIIDFIDWKIKKIKAKIDTGAATSSLDVTHIKFIPNHKVKFSVVVAKKPQVKLIHLEAKLSRISKVRSSPIHREARAFVKTRVRIGSVEKEIEINLIDRSNMTHRMLLGRSAIRGQFLVDVAHKHLLKD